MFYYPVAFEQHMPMNGLTSEQRKAIKRTVKKYKKENTQYNQKGVPPGVIFGTSGMTVVGGTVWLIGDLATGGAVTAIALFAGTAGMAWGKVKDDMNRFHFWQNSEGQDVTVHRRIAGTAQVIEQKMCAVFNNVADKDINHKMRLTKNLRQDLKTLIPAMRVHNGQTYKMPRF